jgi:hypothetical protein
MKKIIFSFVCLFSLSPMAQSISTPPSPFIDIGACPFECCRYGEWIAKTDIELRDKVNGSIVVGNIKLGDKIQAMTGEVHTVPTVIEAIRDHGKFKKGNLFYLLTYQGEGFYKVWLNGAISSEEILFPGFTAQYDFKNCDSNNNDCWGRIKNLKRESIWWIKIRKSDGKTGWTNQSKEFRGQDSCS